MVGCELRQVRKEATVTVLYHVPQGCLAINGVPQSHNQFYLSVGPSRWKKALYHVFLPGNSKEMAAWSFRGGGGPGPYHPDAQERDRFRQDSPRIPFFRPQGRRQDDRREDTRQVPELRWRAYRHALRGL